MLRKYAFLVQSSKKKVEVFCFVFSAAYDALKLHCVAFFRFNFLKYPRCRILRLRLRVTKAEVLGQHYSYGERERLQLLLCQKMKCPPKLLAIHGFLRKVENHSERKRRYSYTNICGAFERSAQILRRVFGPHLDSSFFLGFICKYINFF